MKKNKTDNFGTFNEKKCLAFYLEEAEKNTNQNRAFHNSVTYLLGYPVEFLIKMAIYLSGEPKYPVLHSGEELLAYYKATFKKPSLQELINLDKIRNLPIAKFDINKFRYDPSSDFAAFGYHITGELRNDLSKVTTQANYLKQT